METEYSRRDVTDLEFDSIVLGEEAVTSEGFKEGFQKGDQECQVIGINTALKIPRTLPIFKAALISYLEADIEKTRTDGLDGNNLVDFKKRLEGSETKEEVVGIVKQLSECMNCSLQKSSFSFQYFQENLRRA